jgi:Growth arrest and DNA-damage-inducible proteins-interacting protein 1
MFTLKIVNSAFISTRLSVRSISNKSPQLLGLFSKDKPAEEVEESVIFDEEILDPEAERERINRIRDKSRLNAPHRKMLHGEVPYEVAHSWVHNTLKYQRKIYGKYGSASNLDPSEEIR